MNAPTPEVMKVPGRFADPDDLFALDWGRETLKQVIPRLNDALQRVSTLATALLGGSLFFATDAVLAPGFRAAAMAFFLAALVTSFIGLLPKSEIVALGDPAAIRRFKTAVAVHRQRWLSVSCVALVIGAGVSVLGAAARMFL